MVKSQLSKANLLIVSFLSATLIITVGYVVIYTGSKFTDIPTIDLATLPSVDLPEKLLEEAQRLYGLKTRTATLILALEKLIDFKKVEDLRSLRGKLKLDINLKTLRKVRDVA